MLQYILNGKLIKAASLAVIGRNGEADDIFDEIVSSGTTYPMKDRIKKYRETGDISDLF